MALDQSTLFLGLKRLEASKVFQGGVIFIIILSALTTGAKTYNLPLLLDKVLEVLDTGITVFFLVEILLRFTVHENKRRFFHSGWNIFDTLIVVGSLIPLQDSEAVLIGRLLRIFRVLRLVSIVPDLRFLINSLLKAIPRMGYIAVLMFIIFYIYAAIGSTFFHTINETLWGDVTIAMLTLFRVATFEDWTDVMYETMTVYPMSWIFYLTFIFLTAFVFLNMMIGAILEVMSAEQNAEEQESAHQERADLAQEIQKLHEKMDRLLAETEKASVGERR